MTSNAIIAVLGLTALLFVTASARNLRLRRLGRALLHGVAAFVILGIASGAAVVVLSLRSYLQLKTEQPAGELKFTRIGYHQFNGVFTFPTGEREDFALRGDEWQVDARVLKWQALAGLVGFDTAYRLERISGRYAKIEDERSEPRTVYPLNPPDHVDLWELAHRFHSWLPGVDALYGSAAYLPMEDGATYEIKVSRSGLAARPINQAARTAVGSWQ